MSKPAPIYADSSRLSSPVSALFAAPRCLTASRAALPVHGVSTTRFTTAELPSAGASQPECPLRCHRFRTRVAEGGRPASITQLRTHVGSHDRERRHRRSAHAAPGCLKRSPAGRPQSPRCKQSYRLIPGMRGGEPHQAGLLAHLASHERFAGPRPPAAASRCSRRQRPAGRSCPGRSR